MGLLLCKLKKETVAIFKWFMSNYLNANKGILHLVRASQNATRFNVSNNQLGGKKSAKTSLC